MVTLQQDVIVAKGIWENASGKRGPITITIDPSTGSFSGNFSGSYETRADKIRMHIIMTIKGAVAGRYTGTYDQGSLNGLLEVHYLTRTWKKGIQTKTTNLDSKGTLRGTFDGGTVQGTFIILESGRETGETGTILATVQPQ